MLSISRRAMSASRLMSPQFQWLTMGGAEGRALAQQSVPSLLNEVLRTNSFQEERVLTNVIKILKEPTTQEGVKLEKSKFLALTFHCLKDESSRSQLRMLAEQVEKCKVPKLRTVQELFLRSMMEQEMDLVPSFDKCIFIDALIQCYFRKALKSGNFQNIKTLLSAHPSSIGLFEHIDEFLSIKNIDKKEAMSIIMSEALHSNPYFVEREDFEKVIKKSAKVYGWHCAKCDPKEKNGKKKKLITKEECERLKKSIDDYVIHTKEGFVKTNEYTKAIEQVRKWKKAEKITNGEGVVIVDSLNFGEGRDPESWKSISDQFKNVKFASRMPPPRIRDKVMKRYGGNALFCDKLSADDLIVVRMALEMGPAASLVTNDIYRDHRKAVCKEDEEILKIWDDFMIDATYRHKSLQIEKNGSRLFSFKRSDLELFASSKREQEHFIHLESARNDDDRTAIRSFIDDCKGSVEPVKRAQEKLPSMSAHNAGFPIHSQLSTIGACTRFVEAGKVFVDGLSEEWTEQTIRDQFQDDGAIVSVQKIAPTCAFVHFETERDAKNALEASYQKPRESALHCTLFTGYSQTKDTEKRICLRPYNLPPRMTSLELRHLFGSNMGINVVARVFEAANGESRGEGYVHFECPDKDTPLLMSFCWFNASGAMLSLSWLGEGYKHRKPHFQGNFKKFPPSATPDNKQDNLFETPPIAAPFISEIEHYEHKSKPKLLECFLGAFHVHVTHFEGSYSIPRLRQLFSQYGKVIYCEQLSEDCAIISFESLAEAMSAVGGVKARAPTLRIVIIDSYQYHHQNQLFGGRIQEDRKNPIIGNWLYQMGKGGVVKKLPSDEVAKTIDARNRELSALMHAMMDEVDPERKLALYGAYMQEKSFPISNIQMSTVGSGPSESLRGLIVAKVMELFPKSTEVQKAQMIHVMTLIPPSELVEVLIDDDGFRRKTISKTVEWKRSSL